MKRQRLWRIQAMAAAGTALLLAAALAFPVFWLRLTSSLGCLALTAWLFLETGRIVASQAEGNRKETARHEEYLSRLQASAQALAKKIEMRRSIAIVLARCLELCQRAAENAGDLLEETALVQEDLDSIVPALNRIGQEHGPNLCDEAIQLGLLAEAGEAEVAGLAPMLGNMRTRLAELRERLASGEEHRAAAADACQIRAQEGIEAAGDGERALSTWRGALNEIGAVVHAATGLAEQIRILGVNASIEALRSGETGQSFMLIAEEAERLSEKLLRLAHQLALQLEAGETANANLASRFAAIRKSLQEVTSRSQALAEAAGRPIPSPPELGSERDFGTISPLFSRLGVEVGRLGRNIDQVLSDLDDAPAEEARRAAGEVFADANELATIIRTVQGCLTELDSAAGRQEEEFAAMAALAKEINESLSGWAA